MPADKDSLRKKLYDICVPYGGFNPIFSHDNKLVTVGPIQILLNDSELSQVGDGPIKMSSIVEDRLLEVAAQLAENPRENKRLS